MPSNSDLDRIDSCIDWFFKKNGPDESLKVLGSWMVSICASQGAPGATVDLSSSLVDATVTVKVRPTMQDSDACGPLRRSLPSLN